MRTKVWYFFLAIFFVSLAAFSQPENEKTKTLSLEEAIILASRDNPNLQSKRLDHLMSKFNLHVQEWQFNPHAAFKGSATLQQTRTAQDLGFPRTKSYTLTPGVSYLTPIGTSVSLDMVNPIGNHYNPGISLTVSQPLMRGFGRAIVEAALNNARDSLEISRLGMEGLLRSTVTAVINAYLDVVSAEQTLRIDEAAVKRSEQTVEQTKLFIKAGRKAPVELVTVSAEVAVAKTQLENDKNTLMQSRYALLTAIGIDPYSDVHFASLDIDALIHKYHLLPLEEVKQAVLKNDIQYQVDQITIAGSTKRALASAEDNARWKLDLVANAGVGNGGGGGQSAGINSLLNGVNQSQSLTLNLEIPIDNQMQKQAILSAKIALDQARIALKKERWQLETGAINARNNLTSSKRALEFALDAEKLQEKTYQISYQKYLHGLIDSLELQSAQVQLIHAQQALLRARIAYLKSLVDMDALTGNTLKTWQLKVRL